LQHCEEGLAILREPDVPAVPVYEGDLLETMGLTHLNLGETALAETHLRMALEIYSRLGERIWTAEAHMYLGDVLDAAGDPGQARQEWERSLSLYRDLDPHRADEV